MKTINKYFLLALAGGLFSFSACSDDIEREPSPIVPEDCQGAAFSAENEYDYELEPEATMEITLTVTREKSEGSATVGVEVLNNTENVFEVPATVSFADGEIKAPLTLKFPNAKIGTSYNYALKFTEGDYNPYSDKSTYVSGSIIRIKWNPLETAIYTDGMISVVYSVDYPLSWYANAEYATFPDGSMRVRLKSPYSAPETYDPDVNGIYEGYPYFDSENIVNPDVKMLINIKGAEASIPAFKFGALLNSGDGQLIGGSAYGVFNGTKDDYPLGEVTYDEEGKLSSIVFGPNSLFASIESLWAEGQAGIAANPTTLFFSLESWKKYQEDSAEK